MSCASKIVMVACESGAGGPGRWRARPGAVASFFVAWAAVACTGVQQEPASLPPQTVTANAPTESPGQPPPRVEPLAAPVREGQREEKDPTAPVVIDSGEVDEPAPSIVEAARAERERKRSAEPPRIVLTNKNLAELAAGATLTFIDDPAPESEQAAGEMATGADTATPGGADVSRDEAYWRRRALELRSGWKQTVQDIERLQAEVEERRQAFYAEDDPYLRDSQIKPSWDHALEALAAARARAANFEKDLEAFLEEGRKAGAYPGWLREGAELEPTADELEERSPAPAEPDEAIENEP